MTTPPKRATIACGYCRRRKRRCNGETPQCRTCRVKGLECEYRESSARRAYNVGTHVNSQRFEAIENVLREHADVLQDSRFPRVPASDSTGVSPSQGQSSGSADVHLEPQARYGSQESPLSFSTWAYDQTRNRLDPSARNDDDTPPITIPLGHQTSTSSVLVLPQCRQLVGEYPEEFFFLVESRRFRLDEAQAFIAFGQGDSQQSDTLDRTLCNQYLSSYLARVYPFHPFLDSDEVGRICEETMNRGIGSDHNSALVLSILALGAIALEPVSRTAEGRPGEVYFQKSLRILLATWTFNFSGDVRIPQALVLCAIYFTYRVEPLSAWRLIYMASTSIQELLSRYKDIGSSKPEMQTLTRLSWVCFSMESDLLAEFHQPRSGIELLVDRMPFPNYGENATPANLYALAEISVRTLLNRIHHSLFFADSLTIYAGRSGRVSSSDGSILLPDASHTRVCEELSRQLETWYDKLPEEVKPDLTGATKGNRQACLLRLRYWSSKQNIYRAFLIYVTSRAWNASETVPQTVYEMCVTCIHACRMYVMAAGHLIYERTPYTYSCAMACLTSALLLSIAARSPPLTHLVEDIGAIHQLVTDHLEPWAQPRTSSKSAYEIVSLVATKQSFQKGQ